MEGDKILKSDEEGGSAYSVTLKWRHIYEVVYAKAKPLPSPSLRTYYVHAP